MCSVLNGYQLDASLSRDVWWRGPPCFGDKESYLLGFGNAS